MPSRTALAVLLALSSALGQGTSADYERAAQLDLRYRGALQPFRPQLRWLEDGQGVFWAKKEGAGYFMVEGASGELRELSSPPPGSSASSEDQLQPLSVWKPSQGGTNPVTIRFENWLDQDVRLFWIDSRGDAKPYGVLTPGESASRSTYEGHSWVADLKANDLVGLFVAGSFDATAIIDENSQSLARKLHGSADAEERLSRDIEALELYASDHQVFMKRTGEAPIQLTQDGTPEDSYTADFHLSPDLRYALAFQRLDASIRRIQVLDPDATGDSQLQWQSRSYPKPGDILPRRRPRLFDLQTGRAVPIDDSELNGSYGIDEFHWSKDSSRVSLVVTYRGHQLQRLIAIDAASGEISTLVEESSETFVDTTQKTMLHWLDDRDQFLWASERSGYNSLYLFDAKNGDIVRQLTSGECVVRAIEEVDEDSGLVWIKGYGAYPDQNPTYAHLARLDLDQGSTTWLTRSNGTHTWSLDPNRELFIARWSRVDQPTVTELRRATDGSLVRELGRDDDTALRAAGFLPPERFVAPGRDGKTPIHGILIRPSNFDPAQKYPVVEKIYAGPHDHHVPKAFGLSLSERKLAELGFIVVQIDGMGTNWRSKAFHDVCWQNLADGGLPDRIAWIRAAAATRPELDLERVGIYGGSAGGQNALAALLHHGDFYDAAAADCGCHDNRIDKLWWNEAWMGNLGPHYAANSNVTHAGKLQGELLLTVGLSDTNVDPDCTLAVVDALIEADRDFEFVAVPRGGHGVGERPYLFRRRQDFFVRTLLGVEPRRDAATSR